MTGAKPRGSRTGRPQRRNQPPAKPSGQARRASSGRKTGQIIAAVRPIVDRLADQRKLVVWDVTFRREAGREFLTVALDRAGGIDAEALQRFSETLSRELDDTDAVPGSARYVLEVTSPGAERKLRSPEEFAVCVGRPARISFSDGRPAVEGTLEGSDTQGVTIDSQRVAYEEISQARLIVPGV